MEMNTKQLEKQSMHECNTCEMYRLRETETEASGWESRGDCSMTRSMLVTVNGKHKNKSKKKTKEPKQNALCTVFGVRERERERARPSESEKWINSMGKTKSEV